MDGSIDMAFGCKMHNGARLVLFQQTRNQRAVVNIAFDENVACIIAQAREIAEIACVSKLSSVTTGVPTDVIQSSTKFEPINPAPPVTRINVLLRCI